MSVFEIDEAHQLEQVEDRLIRRFGGQVPKQRISKEFSAAVARFAKAPVRTFVPVLIQREVSDTLRHAGT
jgi:hypothetical protein